MCQMQAFKTPLNSCTLYDKNQALTPAIVGSHLPADATYYHSKLVNASTDNKLNYKQKIKSDAYYISLFLMILCFYITPSQL